MDNRQDEIITILKTYRLLTLSDICILNSHTASEDYLRKILQEMVRSGSLDTCTFPTKRKGKPPSSYFLSKDYCVKNGLKFFTPANRNHERSINAVNVSFHDLALKNHIEITAIPEHSIEIYGKHSSGYDFCKVCAGLRSDCVMFFKNEVSSSLNFMEHDSYGSGSLKEWQKKITKYNNFYDSFENDRKFSEFFSCKFHRFKILAVLENERKLKHILDLVSEYNADYCFLALHQEIVEDPNSSIWHTTSGVRGLFLQEVE